MKHAKASNKEVIELTQQVSGPSLEELQRSHYIVEALMATLPSHTKKELVDLLQGSPISFRQLEEELPHPSDCLHRQALLHLLACQEEPSQAASQEIQQALAVPSAFPDYQEHHQPPVPPSSEQLVLEVQPCCVLSRSHSSRHRIGR